MNHLVPKSQLSTFALIAANLIPLIGAFFFGWNAVLILALFWIENLIIGFFNIIKFFAVATVQKQPKALLLCAFFIFHYGAFCSVHGAILWDILGLEKLDKTLYFNFEWMGITELFSEGVVVLLAFIDKFQPQIWFGITALTASHFVNFIEHFILRDAIFNTPAKNLMAKPYAQILILHAGLILGAAAVEKFGSPFWLLLVIITFKISVEIIMHQRELKKNRTPDKLKAL